MTWQEQPSPQYPQPQRYYRINMAALSWGELWKMSGNPLLLLLPAPFIAFFKLFRLKMTMGEKFPREVSFLQPDPATYWARFAEVQSVMESLRTLGFEHFTTFKVPEMPFDSLVFALMNSRENTFACVYHIRSPMEAKKAWEFSTDFGDGASLTTSSSPDGAALLSPPHKFKQAMKHAPPETLWQAHLAKIAELAPYHGGVERPIDQERFVEKWRNSLREISDFQEARGVYVRAPGW